MINSSKKKEKVNKKVKEVKRFKSAFLFYLEDNKENVLKGENRKIGYQELLKIIGKNWRQLPENKKEKYLKLESLEKMKFLESKKKKEYHYKPCKKLKKPKRYRTAYMIYLQENKEKLNKKDIVNSLKQLGKNWKNLKGKELQKYKDKELLDKERYKIEYAEYMKRKMKEEIKI